MEAKRITIFAGHYGSGKTNIAVNYALALRSQGKKVGVIDLDIVNPYFRTKDSEALFKEAGIQLISSVYANTNVETPSIPAASYAMLGERDTYFVVDVGGDDAGALALGRFSNDMQSENYDMLLVVNKFRPLTANPDGAYEIMTEIEKASHIRFTAIAANPNLGDETDEQTVLSSLAYTDEVSRKTGLPVAFTAVRSDLAQNLMDKIPHIFPVGIYKKPGWVI